MRQNLRIQVQHELSTGIDLTRWVGSIGLAVAVGIVYFVAARLSLALLTKPEGVAVFWPAAGVSAGVLIALGSAALWPVVVGTMAATIVANLSGDRNLWSAVLFGLCNAGEAVLTASLIWHYFGSDFRLSKLRNVLGLAGAAIIGVAVSGIGGALTFKLFHSTTTPILTIWQHWFASDGLGIITVAPLLIELASASRDRPPLSELVEGALAVAALALVSGLAIFLRSELLATVGPVAVLFAPLLWLAARCRPVFAAAAAFIVSLSIVWTTTFGIGYFGNPGLSIDERVLAAQVSILLVTIGASVLAALFAEIRDKRRLAEAALHASETQRYLIETERLAALGGLVAGVAHEISSPIGTSLTVASTLAHRSADFTDQIASGQVRRALLVDFADGCRGAAEQLVANLQRAGGLIQSFKQVAVDRSSDDRRAFDLKLATEQVIASVRSRLVKSQSSLAIEMPSDITLDSYPGAYGQVLTNLIFNAVAHGFTDGAGGQMLIKARRLGMDQVEITFSDDGSGIPEEVQRRVFDPFFTTGRAQGSTGLGLYIVYNLVTQQLGGRIALVSAPGKGTSISMTLPVLAPG
ncbi:Signal transduction histidine kinase [Bradyrhizobium lablabi]|uniref:histidine kinase n=1 Tax=Bradyrhizobium lablabi TaxID=722472 RepID=A0A1M6WZ75_9BRAD|nr:ATP-binding protein [Bradyrhizobium lablabi]SHK98986.1 Signal transduction histidine kinase [Bradyrhizobium lablabi]